MTPQEILINIINEFSNNKWPQFFRAKSRHFALKQESLSSFDDDKFQSFEKLGEIDFSEAIQKVIIITAKVNAELSERSSKKAQYDKAKKILKEEQQYDAGIFIFYDKNGNFRFSLVHEYHFGIKRIFNYFKRFTYFVSKDFTNKTFLKQIGESNFSTLQSIKDAFSVAAVTNEFYRDFYPKFEAISKSIISLNKETLTEECRRDFALLFSIRIIFIGFIQKRKWIGDDDKFTHNFWSEYKAQFNGKNNFYKRWLEPLFFESLSTQPGTHVAYNDNEFSEDTQGKLLMAPYLNGGLFTRKDLDKKDLIIPDKQIDDFFDFLFSHNFTIEESSLTDADLELNPEFLGIIFERLVNKADGAIYTPRTEVDFMCRISLVKWLENNNNTNITLRDLYELFFLEGGREGTEENQKHGSFSINQYKDLLNLLENITICDPAVGSGAFPVGMLQVLAEIKQHIGEKIGNPEYLLSTFNRKKRIISNILYGVDVKEWAVWIAQLRLWITLFIDAPDDLKHSFEAILPSLDFKMKCGDSLVQRIGNRIFPVKRHANLKPNLKAKITEIKKLKNEFFQNKFKNPVLIKKKEISIFKQIIEGELEEKKERLRIASTQKPKQQQHLWDNSKSQEQNELEFNKLEIKQLEDEVNKMGEQINSLSEDPPFIWDIEFAEIFVDKNGFDIVIGNPPYVRQEKIQDPTGKIKNKKEYRKYLKEMVVNDFPNYFSKNQGIAPKSDLYTYFFIRSFRLLNSTGILTFITSNSWLDIGYGTWLQRFMLSRVPILFVYDNHAKRSFAGADINTTISVFDAPQQKVNGTHLIKFVAFKKPFEDVLSTENLLRLEETSQIQSDDILRIYPKSKNELIITGTDYESQLDEKMGAGLYIGDKWGAKYLRAPRIFFTILDKGKKHIQKMSTYFDGERYLNTGGADAFFILTHVQKVNDTHSKIINTKTTQGSQSGPFEGLIENRYLLPLIKDITKKEKKIEIDKTDAYCLVLKNIGSNDKVRDYISWGEKQGFNLRSVTKSQNPWFKPTRQMLHGSRILFPRSFNDTFIVFYNPNDFLSLRFYRLHIKKSEPELLVSYLNSSLFWLILESLKNASLGEGVLDFFMEDFLKMKIPIILNKEQVIPFAPLQKRTITSVYLECGINPKSTTPIYKQNPKPCTDRARFDKYIFDALDLTDEERKDVYRAICQLVWNRISKAQSV